MKAWRRLLDHKSGIRREDYKQTGGAESIRPRKESNSQALRSRKASWCERPGRLQRHGPSRTNFRPDTEKDRRDSSGRAAFHYGNRASGWEVFNDLLTLSGKSRKRGLYLHGKAQTHQWAEPYISPGKIFPRKHFPVDDQPTGRKENGPRNKGKNQRRGNRSDQVKFLTWKRVFYWVN